MALFDDSRAAWGAAASTNPRRIAPGARVGVSWHYPGGFLKLTPASAHASCFSQVRAWQRAHQAKGWADLGYNLLICQHARVIEGRGVDLRGSHSPGVNDVHYGVQFMTSNEDAPTAAMYARAVVLRAALEAHSGRTLRQWGHKDDPQASTACPGDTIEAWVKAGGPRKTSSAPTPAPKPTPAPAPIEGGLTVADINSITAQLNELLTVAKGLDSKEAGRYNTATLRQRWLEGALKGIAAKVGVDIDEQAIAAELVAGLAPAVSDAVRAAVAEGVPTDQLADAVVSKLGARLAPPAA